MNAIDSNRDPALVREDDGVSLSIIVEHDDGDSSKAARECPTPRKLVTFEKLHETRFPDTRAERVDGAGSPPRLWVEDEEIKPPVRAGWDRPAPATLIAARRRLESDIRRLRASGSMIRRILESVGKGGESI